jgi:hypothetical protein
MASATYENGPAVRAVRAANWAERQRRQGAPAREPGRGVSRGGTHPSQRTRRATGLWHGLGASAVITAGYVAVVSAVRWMLAAVG